MEKRIDFFIEYKGFNDFAIKRAKIEKKRAKNIIQIF